MFYSGKKIRDIEMEEKMEELHDKIRELEKHNLQYKEKVMWESVYLSNEKTVLAPDKTIFQNTIFLVSSQKHMLWVPIRSISVRHF